jgi:hypothetical protein
LEQLAAEEPDAVALLGDAAPNDAPTLLPWCRVYWQAWWKLHHSRPQDPEPQPLPTGGVTFVMRPRGLAWRDLDSYARRLGLGPDDWELFEAVLFAMDAEFFKIWSKRSGA